MPAPDSIDQALDWLRKFFDPEAAAGVQVTYQFDLSGPAGGVFHLTIADGSLEALPEPAERPDVVFRAAAEDYFGILAGSENADLLYMAGRLEIEGDAMLAGKARTYFKAG
ncbi:MAG: SCP2 sterol-binding domain-containing protein [Myxococcota bacterium]|nr:SCP2 sterol-binding domain-containing protein [Myxococcota bacterium]